MTNSYERVAELISHIRNARYGEMVRYSEQLIESGEWMKFTTPAGTTFEFRPCEYDYFLAAQDVDATLVRHAYAQAADPTKLMRLCDITGRGRPAENGDRRDRDEVAAFYADEPSGAGARIREWSNKSVVTERTAKLARDTKRRAAFEAGEKVGRTEPSQRRWDVRWHDERPAAEVIAAKLLSDPQLAREVFKILRAEYDRKRRSNR